MTFVLYRSAVALYVTGAFIAHIVKNDTRAVWIYLTTWAYMVLNLYLLLALVLTIYGFVKRMRMVNKISTNKGYTIITAAQDPKHAIRDTDSSFTHTNDAYRSEDTDELPFIDQAVEGNEENIEANAAARDRYEMKWYIKLSWLLFNIAQTGSVAVSILYFVFIYPTAVNPHTVTNMSVHLLNSVIILLEVAISAVPVRLVHAIFPAVFVLAYTVANVVCWSMDKVNNIVYPGVLDWNYPTTAVSMASLVILAIIPSLHLAFFALYRLRMMVYSKMYRDE